MKTQTEICASANLMVHMTSPDGGCGALYLHGAGKKPAGVVWSWGGGWEHVSVSYNNRCPDWDEMCRVKDLFFEPEEVVVQYHPRKSEYKNLHPYCLHLWRKVDCDFETPPTAFV